MTEIYRNEQQNVYLDLYGAGADAPPTVTCKLPDGTAPRELDVNEVTAPEGVNTRYAVILDLPETQTPGEVMLRWVFTINGNPVVKDDYFDIVVPLVDLGTIRAELEVPEDIDDDNLRSAERRVRTVIESITSQTFAPIMETNVGTTKDNNAIRLPKRLVSIDKIGSVTPHEHNYAITKDGWQVNALYGYYPGMTVSSGVPINDPYTLFKMRQGRPVPITGIWGWNRVPKEITEAALLLIEEQLCPETLYRERYLTSMTAADWRIQFNPGAFRGTGNVIADQVLANFIHNNMAVI